MSAPLQSHHKGGEMLSEVQPIKPSFVSVCTVVSVVNTHSAGNKSNVEPQIRVQPKMSQEKAYLILTVI